MTKQTDEEQQNLKGVRNFLDNIGFGISKEEQKRIQKDYKRKRNKK